VVNHSRQTRAVLIVDVRRPLPFVPNLVNRFITNVIARHTYGRKVAKSTLEAYRVWARHVGAIFGHMQPAEITQGDIALYLHRCAPVPVARSACFRAPTSTMVNAGLTSNPCIGVKSTQPLPSHRYITDVELVAVRDSASPLLRVAIDSHIDERKFRTYLLYAGTSSRKVASSRTAKPA
jgi:hypothetical protein